MCVGLEKEEKEGKEEEVEEGSGRPVENKRRAAVVRAEKWVGNRAPIRADWEVGKISKQSRRDHRNFIASRHHGRAVQRAESD